VRRGKRKRRTRAKLWQYQIGEPPHTVTAIERLDRNRVVEVRWWVGALDRYQHRSLKLYVRNDDGVVDPWLEQEAVRRTEEFYRELRRGDEGGSGETATARAVEAIPVERDEEGIGDARPRRELTGGVSLRKGFDLATAVPDGLYVVETEHLSDVRRAADTIVRLIGRTPESKTRCWEDLRQAVVRKLWLRLAEEYRDSKRGGPVWAERCVVVLLQVAQWLVVEQVTHHRVDIKREWRAQLRREWEQITGVAVEPAAPRHSEAEVQRLFTTLEHPDVDPRIALALPLGAEARLGQVARLRRRNVDLRPVGAFGLGRVKVKGPARRGVSRVI
jgi:hypothetical protein